MAAGIGAGSDDDRFRLRSLAERLVAAGEMRVVDAPVSIAALAGEIESTPQASWFKALGPDRLELVAGVCGNRRRLAIAFDAETRDVTAAIARRLATPQPVVEIDSAAAPVHARVMTGDAVDLARLPFHLQHELDGGAYISSGIDFSVDPLTGRRNVGCRRLMLRGRTTCTTNLTDNSDLKRTYVAALQRGERLPLSFVIGAHPADFLAGLLKIPGDEFALLASLRGAPTRFVRGVSNGIPVPADAEMVLEGYLDADGYRDLDGPYGEFWGFYGPMHPDPLFHVTAVTMRADAVHQSIVHGGRISARMETNQATAIGCELAAGRALRAAGIEPAAVFAPPGSTLFQSIRVALRPADRGRVREVIGHLFRLPGFKQVVVTDDDVDVFDDNEVQWATSTRFRPDRDLVVETGMPAFYEDPTADDERKTAKMGLDLTTPAEWPETLKQRRTGLPALAPGAGTMSLREALAAGPCFFADLMRATGSHDGREIALALGEMAQRGEVKRAPDGRYALAPAMAEAPAQG